METTIFENWEYKNGENYKAKYLYKLMPNNWGKRIKKFAVNMEIGIYALNWVGDRYYWADGMTGGGNWDRGGFYPWPICAHASDVIIDRQTGEAWQYVKEIFEERTEAIKIIESRPK